MPVPHAQLYRWPPDTRTSPTTLLTHLSTVARGYHDSTYFLWASLASPFKLPCLPGEPDAPLPSLLALGAHLTGLWQTNSQGFSQTALG